MAESLLRRILIVDDEAPVRTVCMRMLERIGCEVETAVNGEEALDMLRRRSFDLVLTDYRMPGKLDGVALCQIIRRDFPHTFLILMTAFPAAETAMETAKTGLDDYLVKPFDHSELVRRVTSCLARSVA